LAKTKCQSVIQHVIASCAHDELMKFTLSIA
jgi:hypothetical protein